MKINNRVVKALLSIVEDTSLFSNERVLAAESLRHYIENGAAIHPILNIEDKNDK